MAQTQPQPTTNNNANANTNPTANGDGTAKREVKPPTAIEAITKITKILDQLSPTDRKRVLAFVNESNESGE